MKNDVVISIKNLKKSFRKVEVLTELNLEVARGKMLALLGPNGAGKTTTIRILSTLLKPDSGTVVVNGFDVSKNANDVRASIGLTGQYAAVDDYLTGRENLIMMGRLYHLSRVDSKTRAQELLKEFDLLEAGDRRASTYSGGMRRRLDLALSLIATPPILFLDEPTTGLDPRSRLTIWGIIKKLLKSGTTILLTTQYLEEADKLADQVAVLDRGKIIALGTSDELKAMVGRERLEFTIEKENDFHKTLQILGNVSKDVNKDEKRISIETDGTVSDLKQFFDKMSEAGIEVETFSLHKPTLDDVFLKLTGRPVEEKQASGK